MFGGSVYQKVNRNLETGINLGWTSSSNATNFGIGAKYVLDRDASVRAKINNSSQIGLGYQQRLREGEENIHDLAEAVRFKSLVLSRSSWRF